MKKLYHERETIDKYFRDKAMKIYQNIKDWLDQNLNRIAKEDKEYGSSEFRKNEWGGYTLKYNEKFDPDIELDIIFVPDTLSKSGYKIQGSFGHDKRTGKSIIVLPILLGKYDMTYLNTRFVRQIFIHEVIHYLDSLRMTSDGKFGQISVISDYYNSPVEFNAYYQEGISKLDSYLANEIIRVKVYNNLDMTFEEFYDKIKENTYIFSKEFMENLNQRNERALIKRLYDYFETKKKEFSV